MDAELRQERIYSQLLEVDNEALTMKVAKYRNIILAAFTGEDNSGVTQPASRVVHAARSAVARPTLPVATRPSGPEVLTITRQPSADPPMVGRKRDSSSAENCARNSKRTRRFSNVPQSSTSEPCGTRMLVPDMDMEEIFERAGLTPLVLTKAEASRAKETPGIKWPNFVEVFGGTKHSEWPQCLKVPGYEDFLCTGILAQPFMPLAPGKPGLLLRPPAVIETPQSVHDKSTFHLLSATQPKGAMHYRGKYRKIPLPQIQSISIKRLQKRSQERWIKRVQESPAAMREIRARIVLRNKTEREPSTSEVQAYMRNQFKDQITYKEVSTAFRSGKETLTLEGIECIGYDSQLATKIQKAVQGNNI